MSKNNTVEKEIQPHKIIEAGKKLHSVAAAHITGLIVALIFPILIYIISRSDSSIIKNINEIFSVYVVSLLLIFSYFVYNLVAAGDALIYSVVYKEVSIHQESSAKQQNTIFIKMNERKYMIASFDLSIKKSWIDINKENSDPSKKSDLKNILPTLEELYFIYENKANYRDFVDILYWSNTEVDSFKALAFNFENGNIITIDKSTKLNYFLLCHSFGDSVQA